MHRPCHVTPGQAFQACMFHGEIYERTLQVFQISLHMHQAAKGAKRWRATTSLVLGIWRFLQFAA